MKRFLKSTKTIMNDNWNNIKNGQTHVSLSIMGNEIAYISYRQHVGQIGQIYVQPLFRRKGIAKSLVETAIIDMHEIGTPKFWAVTDIGHPFWKYARFCGKHMYWKDPVHKSVSSGGYMGETYGIL